MPSPHLVGQQVKVKLKIVSDLQSYLKGQDEGASSRFFGIIGTYILAKIHSMN